MKGCGELVHQLHQSCACSQLSDQFTVKVKKPGLSVCQTYAGAAIHADDLRITAESKDAVSQQANVILLKVVRIG